MDANESLTGKVVAITGALGHLGQALTAAFESAGARVGVIDRSPAPAELSHNAAARLVLGGLDFQRLDHAEGAMRAVAGEFGRIDILVNAAGGFRWQPLADGDIDVWDQMYAVNLKTAVIACKAALPYLAAAGGGRIINIGAGAAAKAAAGMGPYTAAKSGVMRLTESLSQELIERGITVNAILPGTIDTPQNRLDMPDADRKRWVSPEEIADVVLFLASHAARAVTGVAIPVFGRG
jgi:NAD(P)-dependent dehydrogenase (short-subunit alcohol dehydrogenase family)